MNKIALYFLLFIFTTACSVPYDGERRYIFETTVLDSGNNPIPNVSCNVVFYKTSIGTYDNSFYYDTYDSDLITTAQTDSNGKVRLIFPPAINYDFVKIEIRNNSANSQQSGFDFINIQESDFTNFKITEPAINIYAINELVQLEVFVVNTSNTKFVSNIELIGQERVTFKDFLPPNIDNNPGLVNNKVYEVVKNQVVTLKYDITTISENGLQSITTTEVPISIGAQNINYEISL